MKTDPKEYDAVIVGSGPNGLSAGVRLAQEGLKVIILEAKSTIGGGTRTQELTEPGFLHDVCSAVHPTAAGSPFFKTLDLQKFGLEFIHPDIPYVHPLDNGDAVAAFRSIERTAEQLGIDGKAYLKIFKEFTENWDYLSEDIFGTLRIPKHPLLMARFGWYGLFSAKHFTNSLFKDPQTKALFAGCAAHSIIPLSKAFTSSFGLVLGSSAHAVGWPFAKGGSSAITNALAELFKSLSGEIITDHEVNSMADIPTSKTVIFDLTPHQIAKIAGDKLPGKYKEKLLTYTYGPGVFKIDWALSEPVPWENEHSRKAGTLHLGGTFQEIATSEQAAWKGEHHEKPYVLVAQPSIFDKSRAPNGKHTLWAYCHVPNGSEKDMTEFIENQIERFAPGFRDTIISKNTMHTREMQTYNSNYIGGDINGGAQISTQLFGRPVLKWDPYKIPADGLYICSSSTPPGGGVHGMSGYHAAESVLKNEFGFNS
ncbi:phytoene desaturase family protein [Gracilimonas halophila]|uniref:Pyridine nucleotide-disulfide oxidoreductase domain-containing protein 2 n=1 Tax=Gracilimonas halophila TaxID=1834464 RepID=A0ABW5JK22_9BACT